MPSPVVADIATANAAGTDVTTLQCAKPNNTVEGDLLILAVGSRGTGTWTITDTWTTVDSNATTTPGNAYVYRRYAAAGESANYTVTASAARKYEIIIMRITGVHATTPVDVSSAAADTTADTSYIAPAIDPTQVDTLLTCTWGTPISGTNIVPPGSMTEVADISTTGASAHRLCVAREALASDADTGTRTATGGSGQNIGISVALLSGAADANVTPAVVSGISTTPVRSISTGSTSLPAVVVAVVSVPAITPSTGVIIPVTEVIALTAVATSTVTTGSSVLALLAGATTTVPPPELSSGSDLTVTLISSTTLIDPVTASGVMNVVAIAVAAVPVIYAIIPEVGLELFIAVVNAISATPAVDVLAETVVHPSEVVSLTELFVPDFIQALHIEDITTLFQEGDLTFILTIAYDNIDLFCAYMESTNLTTLSGWMRTLNDDDSERSVDIVFQGETIRRTWAPGFRPNFDTTTFQLAWPIL